MPGVLCIRRARVDVSWEAFPACLRHYTRATAICKMTAARNVFPFDLPAGERRREREECSAVWCRALKFLPVTPRIYPQDVHARNAYIGIFSI